MPHRLIKTVDGKRGDFLLGGGAAYIMIGLSYVTTLTAGRDRGFAWIPLNIGPQQLGWIWVVVGLLITAVALVSKLYPRLVDIAYGVLIVPPVAWALIFLTSWILGTHALGWVSTVTYMLIGMWVYIASDWPNPSPRGSGHTGEHQQVPPAVDRGPGGSAPNGL